MSTSFLTVIVLTALPLSALGELLQGRVIGITDGDTIRVLDPKNQRHRIRLAGIDAPEKRRAFGQASK